MERWVRCCMARSTDDLFDQFFAEPGDRSSTIQRVYHIFDRAGPRDDGVDHCGLSRCMIDVSAIPPKRRLRGSGGNRPAVRQQLRFFGRELPLFHFDRSPHQLLSLGERERGNRLQDFVQADSSSRV